MSIWDHSVICREHAAKVRQLDERILRAQERLSRKNAELRKAISEVNGVDLVQDASVFNKRPPRRVYAEHDGRRGPRRGRGGSAATELLSALSRRRSPASFPELLEQVSPSHRRQAVAMALHYLVKLGAVARSGAVRHYRYIITLAGLERLSAIH